MLLIARRGCLNTPVARLPNSSSMHEEAALRSKNPMAHAKSASDRLDDAVQREIIQNAPRVAAEARADPKVAPRVPGLAEELPPPKDTLPPEDEPAEGDPKQSVFEEEANRDGASPSLPSPEKVAKELW
jgi:hypothetical protein